MATFMPPFSRLLAFWSVLLLMLPCVLQNGVIQLVHSDLAVGYNIEIGSMLDSDVSAAAKLSNGENQESWWSLRNAPWHDSAIQRFFARGPLQGDDMNKLAAENENPSGGWDASKIEKIIGQKDLMPALQKLATATYRMNRSVSGTGEINASMWTLLFRCRSRSSCNEGYFAPMVLASLPDRPGVQQEFFASVWLNLTSNLIVNAIPFSIAKQLPPADPFPKDVDDPELSTVFNIYQNVSTCVFTPTVAYRSLLDASYGLVPGSSCIKFGTEESLSFKILVFFTLSPYNATSDSGENGFDELLNESLNVEISQRKPLPFEECSREVVLISNIQDDPQDVLLCNQRICINSHLPNVTCGSGLAGSVNRLRFLHSITTLSQSCSYNGGKPLISDALLQETAPIEVSCIMGSSNEVCSSIISVLISFQITQLSPHSNWGFSEGLNTSEFRQAPHITDFNVNQYSACIRMLDPKSLLSNTDQAALLEAIRIRARTYLKSFISEHNIAFTTAKGPATSLANFLALILSTTVAVLVAIPGPITKFILINSCRIRPLHLVAGHGRMRNVLKVRVLVQVISNMVLSLCSFLPVLYMAWSERDREEHFDTWDLGSSDQFVNGPQSTLQLRVVYLLSATSKYTSHFILLSVFVASGSCIFVGGCAAWRCMQVFDRYSLLQNYDSITAPRGSVLTDVDERKASFARSLRAITMTEAEYVATKEKVQARNNNPVQLSQYYGTRNFPGESPSNTLLTRNTERSF